MRRDVEVPVNGPLPKIALIGCGGTIASIGASTTDLIDYPEQGAKLGAAEMVGRVPELSAVAAVSPIDFRSVGSTDLTAGDWLELRDVVRDLLAGPQPPDGIVIAHGTATLEETAYFLDVTLEPGPAVVLVGAQRPFGALSSDAQMNLLGAVRVAADPRSVGRGVMVAMNDRIHAARDVTKTSTLRLETFGSEYGPVGTIDCDRLEFVRQVDPSAGVTGRFASIPPSFTFPRIEIVYSYAGADEAAIVSAVSRGVRGLVSTGFAPGIPTRREREALEAAVAEGVLVVQCSRVPDGRVAHRQYLERAGIIPGEGLNSQKARILLGVALGSGVTVDEIQGVFQRS